MILCHSLADFIMCSCNRVIAIVPLILAAQCMVVPTCPPNFYSHSVGESHKCCKFCPPGTYLKEPCSKDNTSVCVECTGKTYTDRANTYRQCISCTECTERTYLKKACTRTADTDCNCISGYFYKSASNTCEKCRDCPIGEGVLVDCTHSTQRICSPCIEGESYSTKVNGKCLPCLECGMKESKIANCTVMENTKCEAVSPSKPTWSGDELRKIIISITPIVLVIFLMVLVVIYVKKRITINCCFFGGGQPTIVSTIERSATNAGPSAPEGESSEEVLLRVNYSSDKESGPDIKELPYTVSEELAKLLNSGTFRYKNWRTLAGLLSFNTIDIQNFADSESPTLTVLFEYSTQANCTIERLYSSLVKMKRFDCANIVKPYLNRKVASV